MECDKLIEQMVKEPDQHAEVLTDKSLDKHRERLAALVAGGKCSQYLGENYTIQKIDNMIDEEIKKLYGRYESRLGATMTKTIGSAMLQLSIVVASKFLPIPAEHRPYLCESLEKDQFIERALSAVSCEFYHRYGVFLAPVTTALKTARYCQFKVTPQIVETQQQVNEEITPIAQSQQVNDEIPLIAKSQARVTKNPRKVAAGKKGALARKSAKVHNYSNSEQSRPIKTWAPYALGVVAIAVVWLFYKTGEEKTSPPITQSQQVQLAPI